MGEPEIEPEVVTCLRCARSPRDPDDRVTWVTIGAADVCPGCLTLTEAEVLRKGGDDVVEET
jgi:hypothetical protein